MDGKKQEAIKLFWNKIQNAFLLNGIHVATCSFIFPMSI